MKESATAKPRLVPVDWAAHGRQLQRWLESDAVRRWWGDPVACLETVTRTPADSHAVISVRRDVSCTLVRAVRLRSESALVLRAEISGYGEDLADGASTTLAKNHDRASPSCLLRDPQTEAPNSQGGAVLGEEHV